MENRKWKKPLILRIRSLWSQLWTIFIQQEKQSQIIWIIRREWSYYRQQVLYKTPLNNLTWEEKRKKNSSKMYRRPFFSLHVLSHGRFNLSHIESPFICQCLLELYLKSRAWSLTLLYQQLYLGMNETGTSTSKTELMIYLASTNYKTKQKYK